MNIGILGSGMVGQTLATALAAAGHAVMIGTREPAATLARQEADGYGNPPFGVWLSEHPDVTLGTFAESAAHGDALILATTGSAAKTVLESAGDATDGKILLDITNPLDFSAGMPPTLFVCNTDSLAEQLQQAFPAIRLVKTLNTMNAALMVAPGSLADGHHTVFVSGNDETAKQQVIAWLGEWFGWKDVIDLGDVSTARGTESLLPIWLRLMGALGTTDFQFKIVR
ncbi:MAG: NAD(P)-binding domain-containing protein [Candidatus Nanopelagicales bacterium]